MDAALKSPASVAGSLGRNSNGHGQRLTDAFDDLEAFPALAESRARVLRVVREQRPSTGDVVAAVESDVALVTTVLRVANRAPSRRKGKIASVPEAVAVLSLETVEQIAVRAKTFDFFEHSPRWNAMPDQFRLHALATQSAAERLARELGYMNRDELLISALLHDIGKLVLVRAYPAYPDEVHAGAGTPEERLHKERLELGVDHALVGAVLARRWGLPASLAKAIERHHEETATGEAAIIRLADMLAHYAHGQAVDRNQLMHAARALELKPEQIRGLMFDAPQTGGSGNGKRHVDPCPLSARELDVLRKLAEGKVYRQIAAELDLSTSTVRTHLHNTYAKLGASDRAQAVLIATDRGWI